MEAPLHTGSARHRLKEKGKNSHFGVSITRLLTIIQAKTFNYSKVHVPPVSELIKPPSL